MSCGESVGLDFSPARQREATTVQQILSSNSGCASGVARDQVISLVNAAKRPMDTSTVETNEKDTFKLCHLVGL